MTKQEFLIVMGVEKMIHPTTNRIHMVKGNKSVAMQNAKTSEGDVINEAVKIMICCIMKSSEVMPSGMTESDLDDLYSQAE